MHQAEGPGRLPLWGPDSPWLWLRRLSVAGAVVLPAALPPWLTYSLRCVALVLSVFLRQLR